MLGVYPRQHQGNVVMITPCLITGANGFIASRLISSLQRDGVRPRTLSRRVVEGDDCFLMPLTFSREAFTAACRQVDCIVHCAGFAHAFDGGVAEREMHWRINFELTRHLAEAAAEARVRRFVFLSSVKAVADPGEAQVDEQFAEQAHTPYGASKKAAEEMLLEVGSQAQMEVVLLRPTMVYGKGGRGNLARMAHWISRGLFPPLPDTGNHRSMVHIDDLISAIRVAMSHPSVTGQPLIVTSDEAPSGHQIYQALAQTLGRCTGEWAVPDVVLRMAARGADLLAGLTHTTLPWGGEVYDRLLRSAWYSPARFKQLSGWQAEVSLASGLQEMLG